MTEDSYEAYGSGLCGSRMRVEARSRRVFGFFGAQAYASWLWDSLGLRLGFEGSQF